jgi:hypothetical protein
LAGDICQNGLGNSLGAPRHGLERVLDGLFPDRMYPSILSFETINKLICLLNAVFPGLKMWDTFACTTAHFLTHFIISIALVENMLPEAELQKRDTFSTLNVGLARTRIQTRATCVAGSGTNRSPIPCAFLLALVSAQKLKDGFTCSKLLIMRTQGTLLDR